MLGLLKRPQQHFWGPIKGPFRLRKPLLGARGFLLSPGGPDLGSTAIGRSNWVGHIHTMHSRPFRNLYGTPGALLINRCYSQFGATQLKEMVKNRLKRACLGPECPFWWPWRPLEGTEDQIWSLLSLAAPPVLDSWLSHTLD